MLITIEAIILKVKSQPTLLLDGRWTMMRLCVCVRWKDSSKEGRKNLNCCFFFFFFFDLIFNSISCRFIYSSLSGFCRLLSFALVVVVASSSGSGSGSGGISENYIECAAAGAAAVVVPTRQS